MLCWGMISPAIESSRKRPRSELNPPERVVSTRSWGAFDVLADRIPSEGMAECSTHDE